MSRYKHVSKKKRIVKAARQTSWAPYFAIFKKFGVGKRIHPSVMSKKRSWRRDRLKI
ncbi:50S ribosomal protein L39e [Candidatus Woesearchaeota archaeon]|nr:50S ribosomal protein L39e [Nanoarchaeota archaeon]MCB9370122.1 50S ribosomal protein L39e [Candidatus Woesearchaeota archaeon]USN44652.1 MAG: 50S ribosomal protein L39e [Candidatus Woesearchaeota archaeon]